jgi:hypothetical protein
MLSNECSHRLLPMVSETPSPYSRKVIHNQKIAENLYSYLSPPMVYLYRIDDSFITPGVVAVSNNASASVMTLSCCSLSFGFPTGLPNGKRKYNERGGFTVSAISLNKFKVTVTIPFDSNSLATRPAVC